MENQSTFQTFNVSRSPNSISLQVKTEGFRKKAIWFLILGVLALALGFLPLVILHFNPEIGTTGLLIFSYMKYLRWVGLILIFAGLMVFIRSVIMSKKPVVIDTTQRNIDLRGTIIPFSNVKNVVKNPGAMGLVSVILEPKEGRKRILLGVVVKNDEMPAFDKLVTEIKTMIGLSA